MKEFLITVNGKSYEVQVEDLGETTSSAPSVIPVPPVQSAPRVAPIPNAPAAPKAAPAPVAVAGGQKAVKCPMPGTIIKINVNVGDAVNSGTVMCILEAMKMENEIVASVDGTVDAIAVTKGAAVNSGDVLISIK